MSDAVRVERLVKVHAPGSAIAVRALDAIDVRVRQGEYVAVVGENRASHWAAVRYWWYEGFPGVATASANCRAAVGARGDSTRSKATWLEAGTVRATPSTNMIRYLRNQPSALR